MEGKVRRPFRRYIRAVVTLLFGLVGFIAIVMILWAITVATNRGDNSILILFEVPLALILGVFAGIFWLPACRILRGSAQETLVYFLLTGALAGWFIGFLVDGPLACAWGSLGASLDAKFASVQYMEHVEPEAAEACTRAFPLISGMSFRGALGACFWILFYWKVFIRSSSARREKVENETAPSSDDAPHGLRLDPDDESGDARPSWRPSQ